MSNINLLASFLKHERAVSEKAKAKLRDAHSSIEGLQRKHDDLGVTDDIGRALCRDEIARHRDVIDRAKVWATRTEKNVAVLERAFNALNGCAA